MLLCCRRQTIHQAEQYTLAERQQICHSLRHCHLLWTLTQWKPDIYVLCLLNSYIWYISTRKVIFRKNWTLGLCSLLLQYIHIWARYCANVGCQLQVIYTLWFIKTWQYFICDHNSGKSWWILITFTYLETGMNTLLQVSYLLIYFTCDVNVMSLSHSWHWWAATASAACMARLGAVADWWRSWPMANTLACSCSYQWWTFSTYLVTVNLFSVYFAPCRLRGRK